VLLAPSARIARGPNHADVIREQSASV